MEWDRERVFIKGQKLVIFLKNQKWKNDVKNGQKIQKIVNDKIPFLHKTNDNYARFILQTYL